MSAASPSAAMALRVAVIAGSGRFPFHVADEAKRQGVEIVAVGLRGWVDPALAHHVQDYVELGVGELRRLIEWLKAQRVTQAIMAGKVTKDVLLDPRALFDAEVRAILTQARDCSVPALLGAVGDRLAQHGITLLDSSTFLQSCLCPLGVLTDRRPSAEESADIEVGMRVARALTALDVGQTVVVKCRVVVALEALEGTDAAIRRAHDLAGDGFVVVKLAGPAQDRRFDLPIVGPETIQTLRDHGVTCLAVEAGSTLLLERDAVLAQANAARVALVGIAVPA